MYATVSNVIISYRTMHCRNDIIMVIFVLIIQVRLALNGERVVDGRRSDLMKLWEETSYQLDRLQTDRDCARCEFSDLTERIGPDYRLTFDPDASAAAAAAGMVRNPRETPRVAVLREEGCNGDREMAAALLTAGFQVWDVVTQDLRDGTVDINHFKGIVFCGGFSFAGDTNESINVLVICMDM